MEFNEKLVGKRWPMWTFYLIADDVIKLELPFIVHCVAEYPI